MLLFACLVLSARAARQTTLAYCGLYGDCGVGSACQCYPFFTDCVLGADDASGTCQLTSTGIAGIVLLSVLAVLLILAVLCFLGCCCCRCCRDKDSGHVFHIHNHAAPLPAHYNQL